jgi:pectate lyase
VKWFGAKGDGTSDDTSAISAAITFAGTYGYTVFFPSSTYIVNTCTISVSNVSITGEGDSSILQLYNAGTTTNFIFLIDQSSSTNLKNIRISNLFFYNPTSDFEPQTHFISFSGISNCLIENCLFQQFKGDGICLGIGIHANSHNDNITIRNCRFDGVDQNNRNAISITDGKNIIIENNRFKKTTKNTMTSAIDIETDVTTTLFKISLFKIIFLQYWWGFSMLQCGFPRRSTDTY